MTKQEFLNQLLEKKQNALWEEEIMIRFLTQRNLANLDVSKKDALDKELQFVKGKADGLQRLVKVITDELNGIKR